MKIGKSVGGGGMNVDGNVACSCARCVRKGMVWSAGRAIGISVRATPPTAHILWGPPKDQALSGFKLPSHSMLVDLISLKSLIPLYGTITIVENRLVNVDSSTFFY